MSHSHVAPKQFYSEVHKYVTAAAGLEKNHEVPCTFLETLIDSPELLRYVVCQVSITV